MAKKNSDQVEFLNQIDGDINRIRYESLKLELEQLKEEQKNLYSLIQDLIWILPNKEHLEVKQDLNRFYDRACRIVTDPGNRAERRGYEPWEYVWRSLMVDIKDPANRYFYSVHNTTYSFDSRGSYKERSFAFLQSFRRLLGLSKPLPEEPKED